MGSNANRHFDKNVPEWGSKARKEIAKSKKHSFDDQAIEDGELEGKPIHGGKRRKKDTKRWCRGKVGQEHIFKPFDKYPWMSTARFFRYTICKCDRCGKEKYLKGDQKCST